MKIINFLICPKCKSYKISLNNKIMCTNCKNEYYFDSATNQVIFEEVHKPINTDENIYYLKKNKVKRLSWRELNYLKTKEFINNISKNNICLDIGSGPMTNKNLFKKFDNIIYMDGAKFKSVNIVCNFEKLIPLRDNTIDFIFMSNVLEHMFYPLDILKNIHRILKKDGKCLIFVPYSIKLHQEPHDYHRYTKHSLKRLLENSNFIDFKIEEMGSISNVVSNTLLIDMETKRNNSFLTKKIIFLLQWIIYKLFLVQRRFDSTSINTKMPQGYSIEIKK